MWADEMKQQGQGNPLGAQVAGLGQRGVDSIIETDGLDQLGRPLQASLRSLFKGPVGGRVKNFLNGTWFGHPLHPAVTDIPLGTWTAAVAFDLLTVVGKRDYSRAANASLWMGIAGAVAAAATGIADWTDTGREQRRVGLVHAGLNTAALGMQIASVIGRRRGARGARLLSAAGLATAGLAAYLGGELVFRQGTQVNRTAWLRGPLDFTPVMAAGELASEVPTRVDADGDWVLLVRHQGELFALDDTCSHAGCPLSSGHLVADCIVCPCHGSTFRLRDGAVLRGPSPYAQPTLDVRVEEGQIEVRRRQSEL